MPEQSEITAARIEARRKILFAAIPHLDTKIGVEIGPLCYPTLTKDESNVLYLDRTSTSQLRSMFSNDYPGEHIVEVDVVSEDMPLQNVLAGRKFDYFIANHVIEHVPDLIGWLKDIHGLLNDGGFVFLAVPDKRFTFDVKRMETSCGHIIVDYENDSPADAAEHIIDALLFHETQPDIKWEDISNTRYSFIHHHHVFCYETFLELIIAPLIRLRYLQYSVAEYQYSKVLDNEFVIVLQKETSFDNIEIPGKRPLLTPTPPASCKTVKTGFNSENYQSPDLKLIIQSGLFDEKWYSEKYPVVSEAGLTPLTHYYYSGYKIGFDPSPGFNSQWYLEQNPDVAAANYNPLWHYIVCGQKEGRRPVPNSGDVKNEDLKSSQA